MGRPEDHSREFTHPFRAGLECLNTVIPAELYDIGSVPDCANQGLRKGLLRPSSAV